MRYLIQFYSRLVFLQVKPQDCPPSEQLRLFLLVTYFLLSIFNSLAVYDIGQGAVHTVVDIAVLYLFTHVLLSTRKERILQTLNAFLGAGIIIGLVHTIFSYALIEDRSQESVSETGTLIFFTIVIWLIVVYGHIVRHAAEVSLPAGISISLGYTIINAIFILTVVQALGFQG